MVNQGAGIGRGKRTVVMISGGGTNLQAIINEIQSSDLSVNLRAVVSDRPGVLGLERAVKAGIPTRIVDYRLLAKRDVAERELEAALEEFDPELIVLAGFMRILPDSIVERFDGRMLNIHPSLLPKFRGLDTYRRAIEAGETHHGSTVHFVIPELDAGPPIIQYRVRIQPDETETSLQARVQQGEYLIYPQAVGWFGAGRLRLENGEVWLDGLPLPEPVVIDES